MENILQSQAGSRVVVKWKVQDNGSPYSSVLTSHFRTLEEVERKQALLYEQYDSVELLTSGMELDKLL